MNIFGIWMWLSRWNDDYDNDDDGDDNSNGFLK